MISSNRWAYLEDTGADFFRFCTSFLSPGMNVIVHLLALANGGLEWEVITPPNLLQRMYPTNLGRSAKSLLGVFREAATEDWEPIV